MFARAITSAVEVPLESLMKLEVTEIDPQPQSSPVTGSSSTTLALTSLTTATKTTTTPDRVITTTDVASSNMTKLEVTEIQQGSGSRRLQSIETKWYEVAYEIIVPSDMNPNHAVIKANRIAVPGTAESKLFSDALMATDGVERVGKIIAKRQAYIVSDEISTVAPSAPKKHEEDDNVWRSFAIAAVAIVLVLSCLVLTSAFLIKRKYAASDSMEPASSGAEADIEDGRNLVNDMQMPPAGLSTNSTAQESSMKSTHQESTCAEASVVVPTPAPASEAAEVAPTVEQRNSKDPLTGVLVHIVEL